MGEFNDILTDIVDKENKIDHTNTDNQEIEENHVNVERMIQPFDLSLFLHELYEKSEKKNRLYAQFSSNISAYDVAHNCIRQVIYKLNKTPVKSFADKWGPLSLRAVIGSAIHEWIQNTTDQFTESEVSLKIPSIRFSGRLDNLIGNNILVEIKSCTYKDYKKIIGSGRARIADFYQCITYKYILENFIEEAKDPNIKIRKGTNKPKYDKYEIDTIQFIYIAHDIMASDVDSFSEAIHIVDNVKKTLNSRSNHFYFMTTVKYDLNKISNIELYTNYVKEKIEAINYYLDNNLLPGSNDKFIDKHSCFFCLYKDICDISK